MSAATFVASESGNEYQVCGREVRIRYSTGSGVVLTFDSARQARHYASRHGRPVRRRLARYPGDDGARFGMRSVR